MNGGTNPMTNPTAYTVTSNLPIPVIAPQGGYTFTGWTVAYASDSGLTDITVPAVNYSIPTGATGNIALTANWGKVDYTLSYAGIAEADAFAPKPEGYAVESTFPIPVGNPTRTGYTFTGWTVDYANSALTDIATPKLSYGRGLPMMDMGCD